jgi:glyceraldehyde 3-phosphate dehydrogenase
MKIGINGFGRIGRAFFRLAFGQEGIEIVAVNDPYLDPEVARYLLRYDSVYGRYERDVALDGETLQIGTPPQAVPILKEKSPSAIGWGDLDVDLVVEATGVFRALDGEKGCAGHLEAGASRVLLTVPPKGEGAERIPQIVYGVNHEVLASESPSVVSAASCTTNSLVPVAHVLEREIGIAQGLLTTVHGYTADQRLVDAAHKPSSLTRGRAAAVNIVPTSTGAAKATAKVVPTLAGKMDGTALRVPVVTGSVSDFTFVAKRDTSVEEIHDALRAAEEGELEGLLGLSHDPLVSTDIIGDPRPSIVDLTATLVVERRLAKVMAFYDNEWGYTNQLLRIARAW